jgi:hypothetical protein
MAADGAAGTDPRLLLLAPADSVLVACRGLDAGTRLAIEGTTVVLDADLGRGHKLARRALAPGDTVLKHGLPIGTMTRAAARGAHVHTHNLASDYTPTPGAPGGPGAWTP